VLEKTCKTGLLAFGSFWILHLPIRRKRTVVFCRFRHRLQLRGSSR